MSLQLPCFPCVNVAWILNTQWQLLPYRRHIKSVLWCLREWWAVLQSWSLLVSTHCQPSGAVSSYHCLSPPINRLHTQNTLFRITSLFVLEKVATVSVSWLATPRFLSLIVFLSLGIYIYAHTHTHSHLQLHANIYILTYVSIIHVNLC